MKGENKTKAQLIEEMTALRNEFGKLKVSYEAVSEEKRKYEAFLENTDDYCFETDLAGKITFCNTAAYRMLGYEREEYLNLKGDDRYESLEESKRVSQIYNQIYRTGKSVDRFNYNLRKKDGTIQTVEVSASLIYGAEGKPIGFRGVARSVTERKRAEEELRRYKDFVENVNDSCFEFDLNGRYIFFNDALCHHSGYTRDELLRGSWRRQLSSSEVARQAIQTYQNVLRTGIPAKFTSDEIVRKDGTKYSAEFSISLARDDAGNPHGWLVIGRDVTDRVKLEKELTRYKDFVENVYDACYEVDLNGRYIFVNDAACCRSGYTREEILQGVLTLQAQTTSEEERRKALQFYKDVSRTGIPMKIIMNELLRKDGTIYSAELSISSTRDAAGKPAGFRIISRDVTERMKMEADQARYRNFLEGIDENCLETDLEGNLTFYNEALCKFFECSRDELQKMNFRQIVTDDEVKRIYKIFNEVYQTGKAVSLYNYEMIRRNGQSVFLDLSIALIRDAAGNPIGFRIISRDVTERKKTEEDVLRYKEFVENVDDGCYEVDLNGRYTIVNDAMCRRSGYTREEMLAMNPTILYTNNEEIEQVVPAFIELHNTGIPQNIAHPYKRKDGSIHHVETSLTLMRNTKGEPVGFRGISRDVTERIKMEQEQVRYRNFIESIDDICFENDLQGTVTFFNNAMCKILNKSPEEMQNANYRRLFSEDTVAKIYPIYNEIYLTGKTTTLYNFEINRTDGETRFLDITVGLIHDVQGNPIGFRGVAKDVTQRKKSEEDLERYKLFVENIEDSCYETDSTGKYTFVNEALCRRSGYKKEELLTLTPGRLYVTMEDRERVRPIFMEVYNTGIPRKVTYQYLKKNGESYDIENSISLMRDAQGNPIGFRGIARDVTERMKMEQERERYRNFLENIDEMCWENDLQGRLTFGNEVALKRFRYDTNPDIKRYGSSREEQVKAKISYQTYVSPENVERFNKMYLEVYTSGKSKVFYNVKAAMPSGGYDYRDLTVSLIHDEAGKPTGFRSISRDVTERLKMQKEQERYSNFLDNIDDYCFESDLNGNLIFANEKTLKLLGMTQEQLQQANMNYRKYLRQDSGEKYFKIYRNVYTSGVPAQLYNLDINMPGSEHRYLDITISLIRNDEGNPAGFRMIARDVTERKEMEHEQERLRAQLTQSEKLEAIGTLAGGIAHDFNNLLMGIQGYTSLMLMDIEATHPFYEQLKIIEDQVKSGADLTKQLLGYARGGRYEMKATNMNELIKKTASMFGRTKKDIRMHQNYSDELWNIEADQGQMEQVLLNLFVNASQAMPGGGAIYLKTENVELDEQYVKPYDVAPGRYIKISLTDTGIGMDEKTRQRIFEPFFTTKDMGKGAGLGLASSYGIIKGHKGIINCYSEVGHGTTFTIYLSATTESDAKGPEPTAVTAADKKINILLVDDEKTITDVTGAMLAKLGHRVMIAHGGQDAVVMYRMNHDHIDLVIMDMIMPDMNGGEAIEKIKAINPDVKVLLSSGYSINGVAREIMDRAGVKGFLQKPFQMDQLINKIKEVMVVS